MIPFLGAGWAVLAVVFAVLWTVQLRTRNATSVDAAWAASIAVLGVGFALWSDGDPTRRLLVGAMIGLWAGRLAWFLFSARVLGEDEEDGRYRSMREAWGENAPKWFFVFYQGQAFVAVLFALPACTAMRGGPPSALAMAAAVAIWLVAVGGEALADSQLDRWRKNHRGKTCRAGLWRYSRHPNYFFEWVHWWAYVVLAPGQWTAWLGPVLMFLFLFRLTGIPYTEKQARKSRPDYEEYQRTTSAFFPWFPKESS